MKFIIKFFVIFLVTYNSVARETGQTEITAEDGIEVFQEEKYYLLKKNVRIESDNFNLFGDNIKIYFEKDLYDITKIDAKGNVKLISNTNNVEADGNELKFYTNEEEIFLSGIGSTLITNGTTMISDGYINVKNLLGEFVLNGANSKLETQDILIEGSFIEGFFRPESNINEILKIEVKDEKLAYVKSEDTEMYANIIKYNKETSLIELSQNVKIIDEGEIITGDYGQINTQTNSYKMNSNDSKKVKVVISNKNE